MLDAWTIVRSFKRNCPRVHLTRDEEAELARLVHEAIKDALQTQGAVTRDAPAGDPPNLNPSAPEGFGSLTKSPLHAETGGGVSLSEPVDWETLCDRLNRTTGSDPTPVLRLIAQEMFCEFLGFGLYGDDDEAELLDLVFRHQRLGRSLPGTCVVTFELFDDPKAARTIVTHRLARALHKYLSVQPKELKL